MRIRWLLVLAVLAGCGGDDEGVGPGNGDDAGRDATSRDVSQDAPRADVFAMSDGTGATDGAGGADGASRDAADPGDATGANDVIGTGDAVGDASNAGDGAGTGDAGLSDARSDAATVDARTDARDSASDTSSNADVSTPPDAPAIDATTTDAGSPDADGAPDDVTTADAATDAGPTDGGPVEACTPTSASVTRTPTSAVSAFFPAADVAWTNLFSLTDQSQISAANTMAALDATSTRSRPLIVTGYGFTIPDNAVIDGFVVDIWRGSPNSATAGIRDEIVRLQSGLTNSLTRAKTDKWPGVVFTSVPKYGGTLDKWGVSWTPAMVNASSFGINLTAQRFGTASDTPQVGWVEITVHYRITCP